MKIRTMSGWSTHAASGVGRLANLQGLIFLLFQSSTRSNITPLLYLVFASIPWNIDVIIFFCNMVPSVPCDEVSARGAGAEKRNSSSQASWWIILSEVSNFMFLKAKYTLFFWFPTSPRFIVKIGSSSHNSRNIQTKITFANDGVYPCPWTSLLTGKREMVYWLAPTRVNTLWYFLTQIKLDRKKRKRRKRNIIQEMSPFIHYPRCKWRSGHEIRSHLALARWGYLHSPLTSS